MKRILINATHNEEIRVALCKDNHLYDFDLENRTREQKKANIYKGHITRVEPSLEAVFVEYGSTRQGFLPLREIAPEYLKGNPRSDNIRELIKEGDEVIIQVEKEERGNKGAAVSTYISLAGRYLVLMPNNPKAGGISRQISGKVREEMKQIINSLSIPRGMSVIVRTAGIGKGFEDLQHDLNHLLDAWASILEQNRTRPSPCLVHQEAGVVTRAVRDYLRDDIGEVWIDSENAYNEAAHFIASVMPTQMSKLKKYTDYEPLFSRFGIERQIETAYQREVRLPSGGSIVIDQTEAMVAIDINSAKSTKGSDVAETAYHTNLEAAEEIARQLRLRDMGGLIVIDFIDMAEPAHQKEVEKRLIDATRYDRARVQFAEISKFGLMEMSRQRLRPSLEEATGYLCPRCHGNGMIRDLRSLALSIMRQIEQIALKERCGEIQAEVPTEIAAFLLNEKRESLVYLEQDSGVRVTILPHAHLESPNFSLHYNPDGFAPASYERIVDVEERELIDRGYEVNWQTPEHSTPKGTNHWDKNERKPTQKDDRASERVAKTESAHEPKAVAWLSNLFAPKAQAALAPSLNTTDAASAIEALVNSGATSLGASGQIALPTLKKEVKKPRTDKPAEKEKVAEKSTARPQKDEPKADKTKERASKDNAYKETIKDNKESSQKDTAKYPKRDAGSKREPRVAIERGEVLTNKVQKAEPKVEKVAKPVLSAPVEMPIDKVKTEKADKPKRNDKPTKETDIVVKVESLGNKKDETTVVHLSLDGSKTPPQTKPSLLTELSLLADEAIGAVLASLDKLTQNIPTPESLSTKPLTDSPNTENLVTESLTELAADPASESVVAKDSNPPVADENTPESTPISEVQVVADVSHPLPPLSHLVHTQSLPTKPVPHPDPAKLTALAAASERATNDPRVVLGATKTALTGTAGELIYARLANAKECLANDGFVACFLRALDSEQPSFANYGYPALAHETVSAFYGGIGAKGEFATSQGKTPTPAPIIGVRASNDPRGDYVAPKPVVTELPAVVVESVAPTNIEPTNIEPSSEPQISEPPSESQTAVDEPTPANLSDMAEQALDSVIETVENLIAEGKALLGDNEPNPPKTDEVKGEYDIKNPSENYKNMIENIAVQLLPQTGLLNLANPKKAKKTATKKPTKVNIKLPKSDSKPKTEIRKRKVKVDEVPETSTESEVSE